MAKKYLKNEKGIVRSITSDNLQLEKPLLNENYDIEVHNRNMDKIDSAIQEVKGKVDGLELTAERVSIADPTNKFEATNVEDALLENKTSILNNTDLANQALNKANEAFQRGDNVKTQLVDKLISEGLDVSTNNSFEELIGSIALGKKWASGTYSTSIKGDSSLYSWKYQKINYSLDFTPSKVFVHCVSVDKNDNASNATVSKNIVFSSVSGQTAIATSTYILGVKDISNTDFTIEFYSKNGGGYIIAPINWYAFE